LSPAQNRPAFSESHLHKKQTVEQPGIRRRSLIGPGSGYLPLRNLDPENGRKVARDLLQLVPQPHLKKINNLD